MHALGVQHEQTRMDRDNFVTIHPENMVAGGADQFAKTEGKTVTTYDYLSVMQYDWWSYSKDITNGLATITKKDGSKEGLGSDDATASDIALLKAFYCPK